MTRTFIADAKANGIINIWVANYKIAKELKLGHLRGGKITRKGEGHGVEVLAFGFDELDNIVALCKDGFTRTFI